MSAVQYLSRPAANALDTLRTPHLNTLQEAAGKTDTATDRKNREVAQQFEALLIQQMLKQARQSEMGSFLDSDQSRLAQSLHDEELSLQLASPGMGLAQALLDQIQSSAGNALPGTDANDSESGSQLAALFASLPNMGSVLGRSHIGDPANPDNLMASSISELIDLLAMPGRAAERVRGTVQNAPDHIRGFVDRVGGAARRAAADTGIPERLILSQAALESGWGRREIKRPDGTTSHNLFGIKATGGWRGEVVHVTTTEFQNGIPRKVEQPFRAYGSYAESFADYARLISRNNRYQDVLTAPTAQDAARRIQQAGYATDPAYADKLIAIMENFD